QRLQAADRVMQQLRTLGLAVIEGIPPRLVEQAHVDVQSRSRAIDIRLGHECGVESVRQRRRLDDLLQKDGVVGSEARVRLMLEIGFELARRVFLARGGYWNSLQRCRFGE